MKKLLLLLLFAASLFSEEIKWVKTFDEAKKFSEHNGKIVMLMLTQEGCPTCEYMKDNAFKNEALSYYINANFLPVEIDIYEDEVPDGFRARGTPTFYFTNHKGKKVARKIAGGAKAEVFLDELKKIIKEVKP